MAQNKQKEQPVNKFLIILLLLILTSCSNIQSQSQDIDILKIFLEDYRRESGKDSLYLGFKNSNTYLISRIDEYLELKKDSFIKMPNQMLYINKKTGEKSFLKIQKGDSIYNRLINSRKIEVDSMVHKLFSKNEYENYKKQIKDNSSWNLDYYEKLKNVSAPDETTDKKKILNISKPIYSTDGFNALIYRSSLTFPIIYIYNKKNNIWHRVHTIKPQDF